LYDPRPPAKEEIPRKGAAERPPWGGGEGVAQGPLNFSSRKERSGRWMSSLPSPSDGGEQVEFEEYPLRGERGGNELRFVIFSRGKGE